MAARYCLQTHVMQYQLAPPSTLAAAAVAGGGTFAALTYFWKITGLDAAGETTGSNEATAAVALNGHANLTWAALPAGTTGVNVYRGTSTNAENVLVATLGAVVAYTDTGTAGVAGAPPAVNSAGLASILTVEGAQRDSAHPVVVAAGALFSAAPPVAGAGHVTGILSQYLAAHAAGPEF